MNVYTREAGRVPVSLLLSLFLSLDLGLLLEPEPEPEPEFEPEPAEPTAELPAAEFEPELDWVEYDGIRFQVIDLGATAIYFRDGRFFRNSEADFRELVEIETDEL